MEHTMDSLKKFTMLLLVLIAVVCTFFSCIAWNGDNPAITEYEVCKNLLKDWTGVFDSKSCREDLALFMATSKPPNSYNPLLLPCIQYQIGMRQCKKRSKVLPAGLFR